MKRLDKSLHVLQKYIRDKIVDRIIKLTKGKFNEHLNIINKRHRAALTNCYVIQYQDNVTIISDNVHQRQYFIVKKNSSICCELKCKFCNICIHMYECSCMDYNIKATICKHIHYLCLNSDIKSSSDSSYNSGKTEEIDTLTQHLHAPSLCKNKPHDLTYEIRSAALQVIHNIDNFSYPYEDQAFMLKSLNVLTAMAKPEITKPFLNNNSELSNSPPNKRIEKQKLFSTKKKLSSNKTRIQKPDISETKIIKETLAQSLFTTGEMEHDHSYC